MAPRQIATITLKDEETDETCIVTVSTLGQRVGIGLSRERNGDVEVYLSTADARTLHAALSEAIMAAGEGRAP